MSIGAASPSAATPNTPSLPYDRHVLPNGLRILVCPMPHTRSATVALFFGMGSRYEAPGEQGISHLVEHMLFKGSTGYPTAQLISETIEGVGGILNAATDKEMTVYWAKVASRHTDLAFDLLADMVRRPLLDPAELAKEKKVVLEELGLAQDAPGEWVHQLMSEVLWPDQPLGWEIAGTPETVNSQTRESLHGYIQRGYGPRNAVLVVAGDAQPHRIIQLAGEKLLDSGAEPPTFVPAAPRNGAPKIKTQSRETEQAYLCIGGRGLSRVDPDRYALRVANAILGDGMSSRLFLEVREKRGLAYDVHSYVSGFADSGAVVVSAGVEPEQIEPAMDAILAQVDRLRQERVPETELRKVKEYLKGRTVLSLEDSSSVAQWYASQELLTTELLTPDEALDRIEAVSVDDVLRVSQRVFTEDWLNLSAIAPQPDEDRLNTRLRFPA
ncbi:MAG TPA: pitrilysin family protein [Chloroflexota bacterium]|nr:pitrilysin family protein [Chloroflexota bacterium]